MPYDLIVIGGGIVGIATAFRYLQQRPGARVVLLEKEPGLARHQTGNNSGVIHAGVYYEPGSLKAQLCYRGAAAMKAFCRDNDIATLDCGKLIVATDAEEARRLAALREKSLRNGLEFEDISADDLHRREPAITGVGALFFPATSVVDYALVARKMADRVTAMGGEIRLNTPVSDIAESAGAITVATPQGRIEAGRLIACAGAQSDRIARLAGLEPKFRIIPFRGEYFRIARHFHDRVNHLIYPTPNPDLPFLGIHLTRDPDGGLSVGPNAVLGLSREGLPRFSMNIRDMADIFLYPGFWRFLGQNLSAGLGEMRNSLLRRVYLKECRKYLPALRLEDLGTRRAGVRAQLVHPDGTAAHDFVVLDTDRSVHICNAPSPAATSSLAIADHILDTYFP